MPQFKEIFLAQTIGNYVSLLFVVLILVEGKFGIDLSDESYCLITISNPGAYLGLSLFGYLLHPLYTAIEGNITTLRQINSLFTMCLSCLLFMVFLSSRLSGKLTQHMGMATKATLAVTLGSSAYASLTFKNGWLQTPTYNTLALHALIVILTGIIFSQNRLIAAKHWGLVLIGVGIWLIMATKISTAALVILLVCAFFLAYRRDVLSLILCGAISVASWFMLIYLNNWSIYRVYDYAIESLEAYNILVRKSVISDIVRADVMNTSYTVMLAAVIVGALFSLLSNSRGKLRHIFSRSTTRTVALVVTYILTLISLATVSSALMLTYNIISSSWIIRTAVIMPLGWLFFFFVLLGALAIETFFNVLNNVFANSFRFAIVCLALPFILAFGSNVNYWEQSSVGCIFWVLGTTCLLLKPRNAILLQLFSALTQLIVLVVIVKSLNSPFMQFTALDRMMAPITIERTSSQLFVSDEFYVYLTKLKQIAFAAGFTPGTKVISLTGYAPGALYVLGGDIPGAAWLFGHPIYNRCQYAQKILQRIPHNTLKQTWLLIEFNSEYALPESLLLPYGLSLSRNYQLVGSLFAPKMGYAGHITQYLFKPK